MFDKIKAFADAIRSKLPFESMQPAPKVAVIKLSGVVGTLGRLRGGSGLTASGLEEAFETAFRVPGIKAVALTINSPGGSPVQSSLIYKHIRRLAEDTKLPVFVFVEDVCASGGYWIACAADEIFSEETSIIGSIGVISAGFGLHEMIKKIGVERRIYTEGKSKGMLDPFQPEKQEDVLHLRSLQKDVYETFIAYVSKRRGERLKGDRDELFSGAFWSGNKALELGLVDGIGDMKTILKTRFGENVQLKKINLQKGWFSKITASRAPLIIDDTLAAVEERLLWSRFGL
jgi:signal peptide peptidase SppA